MERLIIAGGGLSGVLTAMAFAAKRPDVHLTLLEHGPTLGGHHTWSFYATDLDHEGEALLDPFVSYRWSSYHTDFEDFSRTFSTGYRSVVSSHFHDVAMAELGDRVRLNASVASVEADAVTLASGERLEADAVIDARGARKLDGVALRWQKFLGQEVRLSKPHGLTRPTIMDATVPQVEGYRFVYVLPFTADTLLIEDTYYAEGPEVEPGALRQRIADYATAHDWSIAEVLREEQGALPLVLGGDFKVMWASACADGGGVPIGLRAGLFHPVTGYSLPASARMAVALASLRGKITTARLMSEVQQRARKHFTRSAFDRLLNRMLFMAGEAHDRHLVLARFHRLPQPIIERFYAGMLPRRDMLRILAGKPPVPFFAACRVVPERVALQAR